MARSDRWKRIGLRLLVVVCAAGAGYYVLLGGEYSVFDLWQMEDRREAAERRVDSLHAVVDSLEARAEALRADTLLIERVAREEYGLVREGEILVRFLPADSAAGDTGTRGGSERTP
jgi:cell division protein FtsB